MYALNPAITRKMLQNQTIDKRFRKVILCDIITIERGRGQCIVDSSAQRTNTDESQRYIITEAKN